VFVDGDSYRKGKIGPLPRAKRELNNSVIRTPSIGISRQQLLRGSLIKSERSQGMATIGAKSGTGDSRDQKAGAAKSLLLEFAQHSHQVSDLDFLERTYGIVDLLA
jgi:hypothetical protein